MDAKTLQKVCRKKILGGKKNLCVVKLAMSLNIKKYTGAKIEFSFLSIKMTVSSEEIMKGFSFLYLFV